MGNRPNKTLYIRLGIILFFIVGCITKFEDWLKVNLNTICGVLVGIALMQIIPVCIAQDIISAVQMIKIRQNRN